MLLLRSFSIDSSSSPTSIHRKSWRMISSTLIPWMPLDKSMKRPLKAPTSNQVPNSSSPDRKPTKQKAKAKANAKVKKKPKPNAISHASVVDMIDSDKPASCFVRVDFNATHSVGANDDERCPS